MLPLTRPVRQALATLALIVFTVVPTGYVALTAWRIHQPGHLRAVEVEMGRQLGVQVTLEGVAYPRPGEVLYRGVVLRQEEPRRQGLTEIARARRVRLRRGDHELTIEAEGLRLRGEGPKLGLAQVGALLQRSGGSPYEHVSLTAATCELDLGQPGLQFALRDVAAGFQADRTAPTLTVGYRLTGPGPSALCELSLTRDRATEPARTALTFKTMEGMPLPARVLNVFFDAADWLGPDAQVDGELALRQTGAKDWEADFHGDLLDVDLNALVARRFPSHRLSGRARVALKAARWADRPGQGFGWVEAEGALTTGQGTIGIGLLNALASEMKFRLAPKLNGLTAARGELGYQALGFRFAMNPAGEIQVDGGLGNEYAPNVVLVNQSAPLAFAPRGAANVRGLIKTLVPVTTANTGVLVPLTPESRLLLSLPVPQALAARRIEGN